MGFCYLGFCYLGFYYNADKCNCNYILKIQVKDRSRFQNVAILIIAYFNVETKVEFTVESLT